MMESLENHVALVTGASSGLGRAIALKLSAAGAAIVCADLQPSAVEGGYEQDIDKNTADLINQDGGSACYVKLDVRDASAVQEAVATAVDTFGRLDILVNNAGTVVSKNILDMTESDYDLQMDVNAKGTWLCCKYAIAQMIKQQPISDKARGRIINLSSQAGLMGAANVAVYSQSKSSVIGLTRSLAVEWASEQITVNAIAPGPIETSMHRNSLATIEDAEQRLLSLVPANRFGDVEEIARAAYFLATDEAGFITGHTLPVDGGASVQ